MQTRLLSGARPTERGAGRHSEEQAQEGDRSTLDSTSAHEAAQLLAGRDIYPGDGYRWTGDIRSKGAGHRQGV